MVTLADRRGVSQLMCSGIVLSAAPSPGKPEMNEMFISWTALHRGDASSW